MVIGFLIEAMIILITVSIYSYITDSIIVIKKWPTNWAFSNTFDDYH